MKERIQALEGLRAIAAIIVVIEHFTRLNVPQLFNQLTITNQPDSLAEWLMYSPLRVVINGQLAVAVFLLISGYVFAYKSYSGGMVSLYTDLFKRAARLYIPFLVTIAIIYFGFPLIYSFGIILDQTAGYGFSIYNPTPFDPTMWYKLAMPSLGDIYPFYMPQAYTIPIELFSTFVLIILGHSRFSQSIDLLVTVAIVCLSIFILGVHYNFQLWPYTALVFLGFVLQKLESRGFLDKALQVMKQYRILWVIAIVVAIYLVGYSTTGRESNPIYGWIITLYPFIPGVFVEAIPAVLILVLALKHPLASELLSHKALVWLSKFTFSIYLTHFITITIMSALIQATIGLYLPIELSLVVNLLITLLSVVFVSIGFYYVVEMPVLLLIKSSKVRHEVQTA